MGKKFEYLKFSDIKSKREILEEIYKAKSNIDVYEYIKYMRWYDNPILNSFEEAMMFIKEHRMKDYDNLSVRYRVTLESSISEKLKELEQKRRKGIIDYNNLKYKDYIKDLNNTYIDCKGCGSKVNKEYIKSNCCPLCGYDLRSEEVQNKILEMKEKIAKIAQEENELFEKNSNVLWLVKIEYDDE